MREGKLEDCPVGFPCLSGAGNVRGMRTSTQLGWSVRWLVGILWLGGLGSGPANAFEAPVVLSVYQGPCQGGDFRANLAVVRQVVAGACERHSQFLAFPECFLSGYESREAVERGARRLDDPELQAFVRESATHDLVVLAGLARRTEAGLFNSVLVIHRGRLLGVYDKVMLTPGDRDSLGFRAGSTVPVFQAHGVRFAVNICADTSYLLPALAARLQGAEVLFTPHYNLITEQLADEHRRWVRNSHIGLAVHGKLAVARANVVQIGQPGQVGYGDSFILSPSGEPLAEAGLFKTALVTTTLRPELFRAPQVWGDPDDVPAWLRTLSASLLTDFRRPDNDAQLREWLENMLRFHRFTPREVSAATGLTLAEVKAATQQFGLEDGRAPERQPGEPLRVLPFPGGRHPRAGFFDGAVGPQRETKVSVFTPWADGGYVVADVPEAIFSNLGLTYLAHTHIPTLWDQTGVTLPRLEWQRHADGRLTCERTLPNGIAFGTEVRPEAGGVRFELWLRNGTASGLSGLRVQNCVMLAGARGFEAQGLANKVFERPFAAARSDDGHRWVVTVWERCGRTWGNELVPCIHSDPVFPDCPPGATVRVRGWLSFFEGADVASEFKRLEAVGWPTE